VRFTLFYRGPLKANRGPKDKQQLRRYFHSQLKSLWGQPPLSDFTTWLRPEVGKGEISLIEPIGAFQFAPLVSERIHMLAELDLTMLRPGPPGELVGHGGDIDNRVKTLLDALRVPREPTALPPEDRPLEGETPFFCLLGDDRLITRLAIDTDTLLDSPTDPAEVVLTLRVTTRLSRLLFDTVGLG
jgi:hypothetical protein